MTGNQYLDTLQDAAVFLPPLQTVAFPYVPGLPLCEAARRAAQTVPKGTLHMWLGGMANGFRDVYDADGEGFARALVCAAADCPQSATSAAAFRAMQRRERSLPVVIGEAYAAARKAQPDDAVTRMLGCFARRWTQ